MNLDDIFAEEEQAALAKAKADIAKDDADPVYQAKLKERIAQQELAAELNPESEEGDTDEVMKRDVDTYTEKLEVQAC